jgi:hypothetical protein
MKLHILVKLNQNERIWICLPESAHFGRICPIPPLYNKISITKGGGVVLQPQWADSEKSHWGKGQQQMLQFETT